MKQPLFFPLLSIFMCSACPDANENGSGTVSPGSVTDAGSAFAECVLDMECEDGYVCVSQICVEAVPSADSGTPAVSLEDAGMEGPPLETVDAGSPEPQGNPWLLSVNGTAKTLVKIDTVTGQTITVCSFSTVYAGYPSTTFGLNGTLYGWNGFDKTLDIIDPCTCEVTTVGTTEDANGVLYSNVPGITADGHKVETLFGLSTDQDELLELDIATGGATSLGPLGVDFHYSGTTWSTDLDGLYAINDYTDKLYVLNPETGAATDIADLDLNFDKVGIEYHIGDQNLYTCTNHNFSSLSKVYRVDTATGTTTAVSDLNYGCNNLAAPWTPVACIDDLEFETPMPPMP
jgi:hypothetical protein